MKSKKIVSALCTVVFVCSMVLTVSAQGSVASPNITTAKTPVSSAAVEQKWANKYVSTSAWGESASCGTPVTVGNYVYVTDSNAGKLFKLDAQTGATVKSVDCQNIPPYFSQITYGDGKIYVPQQNNTNKTVQITAFNADTLAKVWQSAEISNPKVGSSDALQVSAPIFYYNQHIYFGTFVQDSSYSYVSGAYLCLNTSDGNTAWQHKNTSSGYYYAGGTVANSAILVGDCAGNLVSLDLATGAGKDSINLGGAIKSTPYFEDGKAYVSVTTGDIISVPVNADGVFNKTAKKAIKVGDNVTSSPVVYNGRLYVAGGGYGSTAPFSVINASTMQIIYQISGIRSQSTPLVSTAYAAQDNNNQVYIYVANYFSGSFDNTTYQSTYNPDSSCLYVIKDSAGQTAPSYEELIAPSVLQYCSQSVVTSDAGWLYYYNDSGNLFAFAPKSVPADGSSSGGQSAVSSVPSSEAGAQSADGSSTVSQLQTPATGENSTSVVFTVLMLAGAAALLVIKARKKA